MHPDSLIAMVCRKIIRWIIHHVIDEVMGNKHPDRESIKEAVVKALELTPEEKEAAARKSDEKDLKVFKGLGD